MAEFKHLTVLLQGDVDGFYVDGTFGRGGHSRLLLSALGRDAQLLGFDKDPEAIAVADALAQEDGRFAIAHDSFAVLQSRIEALGKRVRSMVFWLIWVCRRHSSMMPSVGSAS